MNIERLKRVADLALDDLDSFDMDSWEWTSDCGTTRCVAGWAVYDEIQAPIWDYFGQYTPEFLSLADSTSVGIFDLARRLLGLTTGQAVRLFYSDNSSALEFLTAVRDGAPEDQIQAMLNELPGD